MKKYLILIIIITSLNTCKKKECDNHYDYLFSDDEAGWVRYNKIKNYSNSNNKNDSILYRFNKKDTVSFYYVHYIRQIDDNYYNDGICENASQTFNDGYNELINWNKNENIYFTIDVKSNKNKGRFNIELFNFSTVTTVYTLVQNNDFVDKPKPLIETVTLNNKIFNNVYKWTFDLTDPKAVKQLWFAIGYGIIFVELNNGSIYELIN